jgi:hypothetical protein
MITTVATTPATPATPATPSSPAAPASPSTGSTLLPPPTEAATDPFSMMYLIESSDRQLGLDGASKRLQDLQQEGQVAFKKEELAIQQQDQAAKHKSFWQKVGNICGQIAKVAGVVASIAAAVATCGAATPLAVVAVAGAVLSTAGFADSEFHVLQRLGVSANLAGIIDTGLSIGGAVTSVGTGMFCAARAAATTTTTVGRVAAAVAGVGEMGHGAATIEEGNATAAEDIAFADEAGSEAETSNLRRLIAQLLQRTESDDAKAGTTLQTIHGIQQTENQTSFIAATGGTEGIGT